MEARSSMPDSQCLLNTNAHFLTSKSNTGKNLKPPKPPEKPLMPYMRYSRKIWDRVKTKNKDSKLWEIGRIVGQMWRDLSPNDKQEYIGQYELEKEQYAESLKIYQNSPAYKQYLTTKEKAEQKPEVRATTKTNPFSGHDSQNVKIDARVALSHVESDPGIDDSLECFSYRNVAFQRFQLNQRLLSEIFTDSCVPDVRTVVSAQRMKVLKKQIDSLSMHQKLDDELADLEQKFQAKKRRMATDREQFSDKLDQLCFQVVSPVKYEEMVQNEMTRLTNAYEVHGTQLQKQQNAPTCDDKNDEISTRKSPISDEFSPTQNDVVDSDCSDGKP